MTDVLAEEFVSISKLQPEERFEYALQTMVENEGLWGLFGENGWLLLKADEDACFPVWPHEAFAKAWEKNDFPDCKPKKIDLESWLAQWLPGMQQNGTLVLMFPLSEDEEGIMLEAEEVLDCFEELINSGS
ncbi:DUF2750 domain-containing protein [Aliiglaciecola sp. LCG003]|uniref:DUF2750 domain-containing protein n=1 Tax=Aliiglaciecola sp. LCG003 TaxID=3053655 RepID=UPI0025748C00|nr:DUF2750 domain-containing protein [Aliiglaciecola sp. LCG003]WJG07927.1 DUF2750 domain-containing protein [Aliiglaciecola sp. LCG003]